MCLIYILCIYNIQPVDAGQVKCSHFAFSWSESVRNPRCCGSAGVAFSEQEEGGINDSYRNEVAAGPPWLGGGFEGSGWAMWHSRSGALSLSSPLTGSSDIICVYVNAKRSERTSRTSAPLFRTGWAGGFHPEFRQGRTSWSGKSPFMLYLHRSLCWFYRFVRHYLSRGRWGVVIAVSWIIFVAQMLNKVWRLGVEGDVIWQ